MIPVTGGVSGSQPAPSANLTLNLGGLFSYAAANNEAQYRALMDAGVMVATAFGLAPGIGLSAEQMATLTTSIVMLVEVEVIGPDGRPVKVLAPRVYLARVDSKDMSGAALIMGDHMRLRTADALTNSGVTFVNEQRKNTQINNLAQGDEALEEQLRDLPPSELNKRAEQVEEAASSLDQLYGDDEEAKAEARRQITSGEATAADMAQRVQDRNNAILEMSGGIAREHDRLSSLPSDMQTEIADRFSRLPPEERAAYAQAARDLASAPVGDDSTPLTEAQVRAALVMFRGTLPSAIAAAPIIPPRSNRKVSEHPDYRRYKDRNRVERMFGKLKQQRRIATRYDKTLLSFESFLNLAATRLWLKSFVNAT